MSVSNIFAIFVFFALLITFIIFMIYHEKHAEKGITKIKQKGGSKIPDNKEIIKTSIEPIDRIKSKFLNEEYLNLYKKIKCDFGLEVQYYNFHCCPNCGVILEKELNTSRKCPHCKLTIKKRTNYLTKEQMLIGVDKWRYYEKIERELGELNYYENLLKKLGSYNINLEQYLTDYRKKINYNNPRNLIWPMCNQLSMEYSDKAVNLFNKTIKQKDLLTKMKYIFNVQNHFRVSCRCNYILTNIVKKEENYDVYETLICNEFMAQVSIELLYYLIDDCSELDYDDLLVHLDAKEIEEYIIKFDISITKFKNIYMSKTHNFIIPVISKEQCWEILKEKLQQEVYSI